MQMLNYLANSLGAMGTAHSNQLNVGVLDIVCNDECLVCDLTFFDLELFGDNEISNSSESKSCSDSDRDPPARSI